MRLVVLQGVTPSLVELLGKEVHENRYVEHAGSLPRREVQAGHLLVGLLCDVVACSLLSLVSVSPRIRGASWPIFPSAKRYTPLALTWPAPC